MKVIVLGSGTSTGVPVIGCNCRVCTSQNPKNRRLRASIIIQQNEYNILVDTSVDLRAQCLTNKIRRIDAVLYTHTHADHLYGVDELRIFNFIQHGKIPIYGSEETIESIKRTFPYLFTDVFYGGGKPYLIPNVINGNLELAGLKITPVEIMHGDLPIFGYRVMNFAYITDVSEIPDDSMNSLKDLDVLIIGALRYEPHPTHFTIEQAIKVIKELKPRKAYLTHLGHSIDHEELEKNLPENIAPAFDGLELII
jgi:phosphoribosyl 1,2-cyclic phosphate phosphodiesterase